MSILFENIKSGIRDSDVKVIIFHIKCRKYLIDFNLIHENPGKNR